MELFVHPPKQPRPKIVAPSAGPPSFGPLIVGAAMALVVLAVALVLFVKNYLDAHPAVANVVGGLLIALVVALILSAIGGLVAGVRWAVGRAGMVKPDEHGIIPVSKKAIRASGYDLQTLPNAQRTAYARASRTAPDGVTSLSLSVPHAPTVDLLADAQTVEPEPIKHTFAELVRDAKVGPGRPLVIGYDEDDTLITGSWEDFYSAGVGGTQGQGKSNTAAHFIAQVLIAGGSVYLADPHMHNRQSLTRRLANMIDLLAEPPAEDPAPIAALCERIVGILNGRKKTGAEGPPLLLVIDEWTATLMDPNAQDAAKSIAASLALITTQGRKYGIYALLLGQRWSAKSAGGTEVRNTLSATVLHRMRTDEARMLTGLIGTSVPKDLSKLRPGECYVYTAQGDDYRLRIPFVDEAGIGELRRLVSAGRGGFAPVSDPVSDGFRPGFGRPPLRAVEVIPETGSETAGETALARWADVLDHSGDYLSKYVVAGIRKGRTIPQIIAELDEKAKTGDRRMLAQRAVAEIIRDGFGKEA